MKVVNIFGVIIISIYTISCNSSYQPKPKGYYEIELPKHRTYTKFDEANYPYSFEYPTYAKLIKDSTFFETTPSNDNWINIDFPQYKCKVFLSYNKVGGKSFYKVKDKNGNYKDSTGQSSFDKLRDDAFKLTAKHIYKADNIPNELITTPSGIKGIVFKVGGNAASPVQFFLTDTAVHFLRGALYYDASPNADSTKPVTDYIWKDVEHTINTLRWKK
jgi:gliding motility-associated lipoprotein GldD